MKSAVNETAGREKCEGRSWARVWVNARALIAGLAISGLAISGMVAGCASAATTDRVEDDTLPTVVVSTPIWADVIDQSFGGLVNVVALMPEATDPHVFEPSAQQAGAIETADVVVINGAGLEPGLEPAVDAAEQDGVRVVRLVDAVPTRSLIPSDGDEHGDEHDGDDHDDDGAGDEHDGDEHEEGIDPHIWLNPTLVANVVTELGSYFDENIAAGFSAASGQFLDQLEELDSTIASQVETIPVDDRKLVTSHDALGYYAEHYGFEVVATMVGSVTTDAEPSSAEVAQVADVLTQTGVPAVFVEANGSTRLAEAIVAETGDEVAVVALHVDSLGSTGGYVDMMLADTKAIVAGLSGDEVAQK